MANLCLGNRNPRVVVAEDAAVFLVARWVARDLAQLLVVLGVSGLENHDAVLGIQQALNACQRTLGQTVLKTHTRQWRKALRLNVDATLLTLGRTHLVACRVVGAHKPLAVPAVSLHSGNHAVGSLASTPGFCSITARLSNVGILTGVLNEHRANEGRLSHGTLGRASGLETLARLLREAVEV